MQSIRLHKTITVVTVGKQEIYRVIFVGYNLMKRSNEAISRPWIHELLMRIAKLQTVSRHRHKPREIITHDALDQIPARCITKMTNFQRNCVLARGTCRPKIRHKDLVSSDGINFNPRIPIAHRSSKQCVSFRAFLVESRTPARGERLGERGQRFENINLI